MTATEEQALARKFALLLPRLNERQRRLVLGAEARVLGHGGISAVARAAGVSRPTVAKAVAELDEPVAHPERVRRPGGGRKPLEETDPGLVQALEELTDPATSGAPPSPLRWTSQPLGRLATALTAADHPISARTLRALLERLGYHLDLSRGRRSWPRRADDEAQVPYVAKQVGAFLAAGDPVLAVTTRRQVPDRQDVPLRGDAAPAHEGPGAARRLAEGDGDTATVAAGILSTWWAAVGRSAFPASSELLVCPHLDDLDDRALSRWRAVLSAFALQAGLAITVCHVPAGTSRWCGVSHRLVAEVAVGQGDCLGARHTIQVDLVGEPHAPIGRAPQDAPHADHDGPHGGVEEHAVRGAWNYTVGPA